jgi:hypothetical protein
VILVDGEGALAAMREYIQSSGITLSQTAKNMHVPDIERAGRVLKERVRAVYNKIPYKLTK